MGKVLAGLFGMLLFVATASAQAVLGVPDNLHAGDQIDITYNDPQRKGEQIVVTVDLGGYPNRIVVDLVIHLDGQGKGSVAWTVENVEAAAFNAPGVKEILRLIAP